MAMIDPVGLAGAGSVGPIGPGQPGDQTKSAQPNQPTQPGVFADLLMKNLEQVNELQQDATQAIEDLSTGRRNDVESVLAATAKADAAFRMLLGVRNKMMDAYNELQSIRV